MRPSVGGLNIAGNQERESEMGYYIRILAEDDIEIPVQDLRVVLKNQGSDKLLKVEQGSEAHWSELSLRHRDEIEIALIERNPTLPGELGAEEIEKFLGELTEARPRSAAEWRRKELPKVKVIYAFQILGGADSNRGWDAIHVLFAELRTKCNGFSQADGEGFSNQDGSQIVWQFSDHVQGDCQMAVLDSQGSWKTFRMDLGNAEQRAAFLEGKVPVGVQPLSRESLLRCHV